MITGSCLCGTLKYEFDEKGAVLINHCHCSRCRKASGAEYATFLQLAGDYFQWINGEESVNNYESSPGNNRAFCKFCGSRAPVVREAINNVTIPLGSLDGDPGLRPAVHVFTASKAPWYSIEDDLPQFAELGDQAFWQPYWEKAAKLRNP